MKLAARRTTSAAVAFAAVGVSSIFLGAAPASAATEACGATGTLISPGICEATFTSGTQTFTPTASMTKLEVLLVAGGGAGGDQANPNTNGYASGGGGGQVKIVDFSGSTAPLTVTVGAPAAPSVITDGTRTETAINGSAGSSSSGNGGQSGAGYAGAAGGTFSATQYGAGGGASASPTSPQNGGAGVTVSAIAPAGSLFTGDASCYGGGGAIGTTSVQGIPGCGAGGPADATGTLVAAPAANTGGGGAGLGTTQTLAARSGAAGVVVVRFSAANVSLAFAANGHGTAPATQSLTAGSVAARPADPTAAGYTFDGWYTDQQLTTLADFAAPVTGSTTYYARWTQVLAATGVDLSPVTVPLGLGALVAGAALVVLAKRRRWSN